MTWTGSPFFQHGRVDPGDYQAPFRRLYCADGCPSTAHDYGLGQGVGDGPGTSEPVRPSAPVVAGAKWHILGHGAVHGSAGERPTQGDRQTGVRLENQNCLESQIKKLVYQQLPSLTFFCINFHISLPLCPVRVLLMFSRLGNQQGIAGNERQRQKESAVVIESMLRISQVPIRGT